MCQKKCQKSEMFNKNEFWWPISHTKGLQTVLKCWKKFFRRGKKKIIKIGSDTAEIWGFYNRKTAKSTQKCYFFDIFLKIHHFLRNFILVQKKLNERRASEKRLRVPKKHLKSVFEKKKKNRNFFRFFFFFGWSKKFLFRRQSFETGTN